MIPEGMTLAPGEVFDLPADVIAAFKPFARQNPDAFWRLLFRSFRAVGERPVKTLLADARAAEKDALLKARKEIGKARTAVKEHRQSKARGYLASATKILSAYGLTVELRRAAIRALPDLDKAEAHIQEALDFLEGQGDLAEAVNAPGVAAALGLPWEAERHALRDVLRQALIVCARAYQAGTGEEIAIHPRPGRTARNSFSGFMEVWRAFAGHCSDVPGKPLYVSHFGRTTSRAAIEAAIPELETLLDVADKARAEIKSAT